jgi:hypothetical protein
MDQVAPDLARRLSCPAGLLFLYFRIVILKPIESSVPLVSLTTPHPPGGELNTRIPRSATPARQTKGFMTREEFTYEAESALESFMNPVAQLKADLFWEPMSEGKLSFKDSLVELVQGNTLAVKALEALYHDRVFDWPRQNNVSPRTSEPYKRIVAELKITHSTVLAALERLPESKLKDKQIPEWLKETVLDRYLALASDAAVWISRIKKEGRAGPTSLPVIN